MRQSHINATPNADGTRNVSFYNLDRGWFPAGILMPAPTNVVPQQPKSLAYKMVEARRRG